MGKNIKGMDPFLLERACAGLLWDGTEPFPWYPSRAAEAWSWGTCGIFHELNFFYFCYSQPVITLTAAQPTTELTTKRVAESASTLYMAFIKQKLILNSPSAFSIKPLCFCVRLWVCTCKGPYFWMCSIRWISISRQLTACLSPTLQLRADLQQHNYLYPAIPLLSPPFIPTSLHLNCPSPPLSFWILPPSTSPSLFALSPSTAFVIDR